MAEARAGNQRVVVTGGAGYIGSHAARALAARGYEVVLYDNLSTGHRFLAQDFPLIEGDTGDRDALLPVLRGAAAVMHFAAFSQVGESVADPRKYFENNVRCGLVLLSAVLEAAVPAFIFSSTAAVYGHPQRVPIAEDAPRLPVNPYGTSKLAFEHALEAYTQAHGLRAASLRYFNAAGADEGGGIGEAHQPESHLIPIALQAAAGEREVLEIYGDDYPTPDGTCLRDYIHVSDLAEAHVAALQHLEKRSAGAWLPLNLGTGQGHSVKEVVAVVEEVTGRRLPQRIAPRRPGDPPALVADPRRAQQTLGWKAERSLRQMVESAWAWTQHAGRRGVSAAATGR